MIYSGGSFVFLGDYKMCIEIFDKLEECLELWGCDRCESFSYILFLV